SARQAVAQRPGKRIDQAAFNTVFGHDQFPLPTVRYTLCIGEGNHNGLDLRTGKTRLQVRTPLHIKTTIGTLQRRDVYALGLKPWHPGRVRPELGPTPASKRQDSGTRTYGYSAFRAGESHCAGLVPSLPAMPESKTHSQLAQPMHPGAQQRCGLHVDRKHSAGRPGKSFDAQIPRPLAYRFRGKSIQHGFQLISSFTKTGDELRIRFAMGKIQPAYPRPKKLSAQRWFGLEDCDTPARTRQHFRRHEARRAATNNGSIEVFQFRHRESFRVDGRKS